MQIVSWRCMLMPVRVSLNLIFTLNLDYHCRNSTQVVSSLACITIAEYAVCVRLLLASCSVCVVCVSSSTWAGIQFDSTWYGLLGSWMRFLMQIVSWCWMFVGWLCMSRYLHPQCQPNCRCSNRFPTPSSFLLSFRSKYADFFTCLYYHQANMQCCSVCVVCASPSTWLGILLVSTKCCPLAGSWMRFFRKLTLYVPLACQCLAISYPHLQYDCHRSHRLSTPLLSTSLLCFKICVFLHYHGQICSVRFYLLLAVCIVCVSPSTWVGILFDHCAANCWVLRWDFWYIS
jgi:hypothetical protein